MKLAAHLLRWYRHHGRSLPWRQTRQPYHILVSEIMLQQTQVERVKLFYDRWLTRFPTWESLAAASNTEVITEWSGLGYNRRALMLRDVAKHIVANGIPTTPEAWQTIKGIGPYTAAAVSVFAQHKHILPIDTNIRRVLGRVLLNIPFADLSNDKHILAEQSRIFPKQGAYYDIPQALFDLASSICTKTPDCAKCPLRTACPAAQGFKQGTTLIPKQSIKKAIESRHAEKPYPDRIYRGRILRLVRERGRTPINHIGPAIDPTFDPIADDAWLHAMIERMKHDAFLIETRGAISLHP